MGRYSDYSFDILVQLLEHVLEHAGDTKNRR